jgi:hypothetical protein
LEKTFRIEKDGTFTAELNPLALAAAASGQNESAVKVIVESITLAAGQSSTWQVTGKLVHVEGSIYTMNGLRARPGDVQVTPVTNGPPIVVEANTVLPGFSNQNVIINLAGDGVSFEFSHAGTDLIATQIKLFFGGTYHKVNP